MMHMSDIIERLRDYGAQDSDAIMDDAADEIERLRAVLCKIRDDGKNCAGYCRTQAGHALAVSSKER